VRRPPGSTVARGYNAEHNRLRKQLQPAIDQGHGYCTAAICLLPTRWIRPGDEWHLGHLPDRSGWAGPQHPKCNTTEGAKRGNPPSRPEKIKRNLWRPSRQF